MMLYPPAHLSVAPLFPNSGLEKPVLLRHKNLFCSGNLFAALVVIPQKRERGHPDRDAHAQKGGGEKSLMGN